MKSFTVASVALALSSTALAWDPDCNWENCLAGWQAGQCGSESRWDCLCGNSTAIDTVNSCVQSSCTRWKDQEAVYAAVDQLCADQGHTVTNTLEATFSMTSGVNSIPTITGNAYEWNSIEWDNWLASASTVIAGSAGPAPAGVSCQPITGWSAAWGPWSAAWTWTECSGNSPLPTTMTMTMTSNGVTTVTTTSTTLMVAAGEQQATTAAAASGSTATVAAQSATTSASASSTSSANAAGAAPTQNVHVAAMGGAAAALFGLMVAL